MMHRGTPQEAATRGPILTYNPSSLVFPFIVAMFMALHFFYSTNKIVRITRHTLTRKKKTSTIDLAWHVSSAGGEIFLDQPEKATWLTTWTGNTITSFARNGYKHRRRRQKQCLSTLHQHARKGDTRAIDK